MKMLNLMKTWIMMNLNRTVLMRTLIILNRTILMWILIILNKIMSMCTQINLKRTVSMQTVLILDFWGPYAKLSLAGGGGGGIGGVEYLFRCLVCFQPFFSESRKKFSLQCDEQRDNRLLQFCKGIVMIMSDP